mgnify:FL=1
MFLFCVIRFTQKITYIYKRNYPPPQAVTRLEGSKHLTNNTFSDNKVTKFTLHDQTFFQKKCEFHNLPDKHKFCQNSIKYDISTTSYNYAKQI